MQGWGRGNLSSGNYYYLRQSTFEEHMGYNRFTVQGIARVYFSAGSVVLVISVMQNMFIMILCSPYF